MVDEFSASRALSLIFNNGYDRFVHEEKCVYLVSGDITPEKKNGFAVINIQECFRMVVMIRPLPLHTKPIPVSGCPSLVRHRRKFQIGSI